MHISPLKSIKVQCIVTVPAQPHCQSVYVGTILSSMWLHFGGGVRFLPLSNDFAVLELNAPQQLFPF